MTAATAWPGLTNVFLLMLGGALGTLARFFIAAALNPLLTDRLPGGAGFPLGTLAVNVAGCLAIGFLGAAGPQLIKHEPHRLAVMVGVLGGFTTFSSFGFETVMLVQQGHAPRAASYVLLSNGLGLAAAFLGYFAGRRIIGG